MAAYRAAGLLLATLVLLSVLQVSVAPGASGIAGSGGQGSLSCTVRIAAVSSSGEGVLGNLTVTISWPGGGRVFISTSPAAEVDTQGSAVIASLAASILAGVDPLSLDFYYEIQAPSIIVGGPSAGAAMALAAYQLLARGYCDPSVVATGMIQPDTSIGPVGGLKEKLEAVASGGGRVFIIPAGQEVYKYTVRKVQRWGPFVRITQEPVSVNLTEYGRELGVSVVEAPTLLEAYYVGVEGYNATPGSKEYTLDVPGWIASALESYVSRVSTIVHDYISKAQGGGRTIERLVEAAESYLDRASEELGEGRVYAAAVSAVEAGVYAELAYAIVYALDHDLDVTRFVGEANSSIARVWDSLSTRGIPGSTIELDFELKAYGKLGIALYLYEEGLKRLQETGGGYRLPYSILGGVELEGLEYVVRARWLVDWAWFWANASAPATMGEPVDAQRLKRLASLMLATARTTTAYLERILSESGAGASGMELPLHLVKEAVATGDPTAQLGLSLEAIAQTTRLIHEKFTLKPEETAEGLLVLALRLYEATRGEAIVPALLLGSLDAAEDPKTRLHMLSLAILDSWTIIEAAEAESPLGPGHTYTAIYTPTRQATTTSTPERGQATRESTATATSEYGIAALAAVAAIALVAGIALGSLLSRSRRSLKSSVLQY